MKKQITLILIFLVAQSCKQKENYEQEVYGKYIAGDSHVILRQDKTWDWIDNYGENIAKGTYKISYKGEWFNGPKHWGINFNIKYDKYQNSFDPEQHIYYKRYSPSTGELSSYRLNGVMPSTGAGTDFIKSRY